VSDESEPLAKLKAVGYWRTFMESWTRGFPSPRWCVDARWLPHDRERIIDYLNSGAAISAYGGYSYCRFRCGVADEEMGCSDLSDGVWMWPRGLAHYVEKHNVKLPDAFVHTMRAHEWQIPQEFAERIRIAREQPVTKSVPNSDVPRTLEDSFDYSLWREWAKQVRPWYVFW
jgi:hypothetical protein